MILKNVIGILMLLCVASACGQSVEEARLPEAPVALGEEQSVAVQTHPAAMTIGGRFSPPAGYHRVDLEAGSFGEYLRKLPLKADSARVYHYDGTLKYGEVHEAVIDMDVGTRDLQQCADAVMRLRAEYLYQNQAWDQIHFNFTNGYRVDYSKWRQGKRIRVDGNRSYWVAGSQPSTDYRSFRKYMDLIFSYAGTLSLSRELQAVEIGEMRIGDLFIRGGSPGHAVIVVDMAEHPQTGEKLFMLAQSYMPAQDIHILKNPIDPDLSPWYRLDFGEQLDTPEWTFTSRQLMRFEEE